jgi:CheY-like chemotaxis protein
MSHLVLIVDDDRPIVEALAGVLIDEGYMVRRAYDGLSALQEAEIQPPDLVLSDIAMPGMNGVALAERLRERNIPVVLLSAAVSDPGLPGIPFVPKPFDLDLIVDIVGRQLSGNRAEEAGIGGS